MRASGAELMDPIPRHRQAGPAQDRASKVSGRSRSIRARQVLQRKRDDQIAHPCACRRRPGAVKSRRPAFMKAGKIAIAGLIAASSGSVFPATCPEDRRLRKNGTVYVRVVRPDDRPGTSGSFTRSSIVPSGIFSRSTRTYRLVLRETTFASSNTGLPYYCRPGETFANEGTQFRISNRHIGLFVDRSVGRPKV